MSDAPTRPLAISFASADLIAPGQIWESVISPRWFAAGMDLAIELWPEVAARFVLERATFMKADEVRAFTQGRIDRPAVFLRYRNDDCVPRRFSAVATVRPNLDALQRQIERAADQEWTRGGTPPELESFEADVAHFKRIVQASTKGPTS
jgi:hypothetical protein